MRSSAHLRRATATAAAAATVLGLSVVVAAAPASADSRTFKDGRGDTWDVSQPEPVREGGHAGGDLRKVVVRHTARALVVEVRFQDLRKKGDVIGLSVDVHAPDDLGYGASAFAGDGAWRGVSGFYGGDGSCDTTHTIDYRGDVITLAIPTRCMAAPEWVKVSVRGAFRPNDQKYLADDALSRSAESRYSRRIARG